MLIVNKNIAQFLQPLLSGYPLGNTWEGPEGVRLIEVSLYFKYSIILIFWARSNWLTLLRNPCHFFFVILFDYPYVFVFVFIFCRQS